MSVDGHALDDRLQAEPLVNGKTTRGLDMGGSEGFSVKIL